MPKITRGRVTTSGVGDIFFTLEPNRPVFNTPAGLLKVAPGGLPFLFALSATDLGTNPLPLTFSLSGGSLPNGLTLDPATGHINGVPDNVDQTFTFSVRVSDGGNYSDGIFSIVIQNTPPVWVTPAGMLGQGTKARFPVEVPLVATDGNNDPLIYSITSGTLPAGVTLDAGSGVIEGIAPSVPLNATYSFTATVDDSHGGEVSRDFSLLILANASPPVWVTPAGSLGTIPMGVLAPVLLVEATSPAMLTIGYTVTDGLLPQGMTINGASGMIQGTPSPVQADTSSTFTIEAYDAAGNHISRDFSLTVTHVNLAPIWQTAPGSLGQANGGTSYSLQLSATDPDNGPSPLVYAVAPGSSLPNFLTLSGSVISGSVYNAPRNATFTLTVTDGLAIVPLTVSLEIVYVPPVWVTPAGGLGTFPMSVPMTVTLQATDRAQEPLTFSLAPGSTLPPGLTMSPAGVITGTPGVVLTDTTTSFTVRLDDGLGQGTLDQTFTITIQHINRLPIWDTPAGSVGTYLMLSGPLSIPLMATDLDNNTLVYSVATGALPPGLTLDRYSGTISGVPSANIATTVFTFSVAADDGHGDVVDQPFTVTIKHVVEPPNWATPAGSLATVPMLVAVGTLAVLAIDPDDLPLTYTVTGGTLPGGLTLNADGTVSGTPAAVLVDTPYTFTVLADDGGGGMATRSFVIIDQHVNRPPVWVTQGGNLGSFQMLTAVTPLQFTATDPDGDTVTYALASGSTLPPGFTFTASSAVLSGTPAAVQQDTSYTFTLTASDGKGGVTPQTFSLLDTHIERPPVWVTAAGTVGTYPMSVMATITLVATSPDNLPVSYAISAGALPAGLSLNASTGVVSGTPGVVPVNTTTSFTVTASVSLSLTAQQTFMITILHVNRPPVWTSSANLGTYSTGTSVGSILLVATDPDGDLVNYAVASGSTLPSALTLSLNGGTMSGTPAAVMTSTTFTFTINAFDPNGGTTPQAFTITAQHVNLPPVWSAGTYATLTVGMAYATQIVATDPDNGPSPLVYALTSALPSGLSLDPTSGSITGTPTAAIGTTGTGALQSFAFTATVSDGAAIVPKTFAIPVVILAPVFVAPTPTAGGTLGYFTSGQTITVGPFNATSPQASTVSYSISYSLPGEVATTATLVANGSASFTIGFTSAGSANETITVAASSGNGPSTQESFVIVYNPGVVWSQFTYATMTFNTAYSTTLIATENVLPPPTLTYSLIAPSTLPAGLSLSSSGTVSGTPTSFAGVTGTGTVGAYAFVVNASDGVNSKTATLTLPAQNTPPTFIVPTPTANSTIGAFITGRTLTVGPFVAMSPEAYAITYSVVVPTTNASLTVTGGTANATVAYSGTVAQAFVIAASDGHSSTSSTFFIAYNPGVVWSQFTYATMTFNAAYSTTLVAMENVTPTPTLTYSLVSPSTLPAGLSLNSSGVISGTPTSFSGATGTGSVGAYAIVVSATDGTNSKTATLTLPLRNLPPTFVAPTPAANATLGAFTTGQTLTIGPFVATSPQAYTISYSLTQPSTGYSLTTAGGTLNVSLAPTGTVAQTVTIAASDGNGLTTSDSFVLSYNPGIVWSQFTYGTMTVNAAYSAALLATESAVPNATITYSLVSPSTLPAGLALSSSGTVSGTPTNFVGGTGSGTIGAYAIVVSASDGTNSKIATLTLPFHSAPPTFVTPTGSINGTYYYQTGATVIVGPIVATSPQGYTITYTDTNVNAVSAVPTTTNGTFQVAVVYNSTSTEPVIVVAKDSANVSVTSTFYAVYNSGPTWVTAQSVIVNTTPGSAVSYQLQATSTRTPITYSSNATFPPGLTLSSSGLLSGTSTVPYSQQITMTATDATGLSATRMVIVYITAADPYFSSVVYLQHFNFCISQTTPDVTGRHNNPPAGPYSNPTYFTGMTDPFGNAQGAAVQVATGSNEASLGGTNNSGNYADFNFGTAPFTVEYWLYIPSASAAIGGQIFDSPAHFSNDYIPNGAIGFQSYTGSTWVGTTSSAGSIPPDTWVHCAVTYDRSTMRLFTSGTMTGSLATTALTGGNQQYVMFQGSSGGTHATVSTPYPWANVSPAVGNSVPNAGIDEIRITKGICRYTANFSPPTNPFPDH